MKKLFCLISLLCLLSCVSVRAGIPVCDMVVQPVDDDDRPAFVSDELLEANPRLMRLMDTLYRHTRRESFPAEDIRDDIKWMDAFRQRLCRYYADTRHVRNQPAIADTMSVYAIADSVIAEARRLWELDCDDTTWGIAVRNFIEYSHVAFEHFNAYSALCNACGEEAPKELLTREFAAWMKLAKVFSDLNDDCCDLYYWGGSIRQPIKTGNVVEIWKAHVGVYRRELQLAVNVFFSDPVNGTFLPPACRLLLECSRQAVGKACGEDASDEAGGAEPSDDGDAADAWEMSDEKKRANVEKHARTLLDRLSPCLDEWMAAHRSLTDALCDDFLHPLHLRIAAGMLVEWSVLISSF